MTFRSPSRCLDDLGIEILTLSVYVFYDADEHKRWFYRDCSEVGRIQTPCIDGVPVDVAEMNAFVVAHFGASVCILY